MFLMRSRDPQLSRDTLKNATASRGVPIAVSALIDFVVVILFAIIGVKNHGYSLDHVFEAARPFLIGVACVWFVFIFMSVFKTGKRPKNLWVQGLCAWCGTLVIGHILRAVATGEIAQISFIIVSICALGVLFFTWRAVAALVLKLNTRKKK